MGLLFRGWAWHPCGALTLGMVALNCTHSDAIVPLTTPPMARTHMAFIYVTVSKKTGREELLLSTMEIAFTYIVVSYFESFGMQCQNRPTAFNAHTIL